MIRSKTYITGDFLEIEIFQIPARKRIITRQVKVTESTPAQRKLNDKNAKKYFVRLVHNNFTKHDLYVDLTYSKENLPKSREEVLRDIKNYIARLRYYRKKHNLPPLKYIYVISNCDQMGNKVRYHVHMIISDMDRDVAESKWHKGYVNTDRLQFTETGVTGKSIYMMRQAKGERSWGASVNLKKPVAIVSDHRYTKSQLEQIGASPDDGRYIEKLINRKKHQWTFTDCQVEYNGRQLYMSDIMEDQGWGNGISILIRARRHTEFEKGKKKSWNGQVEGYRKCQENIYCQEQFT